MTGWAIEENSGVGDGSQISADDDVVDEDILAEPRDGLSNGLQPTTLIGHIKMNKQALASDLCYGHLRNLSVVYCV